VSQIRWTNFSIETLSELVVRRVNLSLSEIPLNKNSRALAVERGNLYWVNILI